MKHSPYLRALAAVACGVLLGCASIPGDAGFTEVRDLVDDRAKYNLHWNRGSEPDREVARSVEQLLAEELTAPAAVQIALLNNPDLQATYETLGVSQADVVEAGLLENPVLFGQARFPESGEGSTNLEFEIAQNFLNILMLPARKKLAAIQFEQKKLQVADAVIQMSAEVSRAYYMAAAAVAVRDLQLQKAVAAENAFKLALRMNAAGNIGELELARHQAHYEQLRIDLASSEETVLESRERLTRLMGLWGTRTDWKTAGILPEVPAAEAPLAGLEKTAIENRLDLAAARKEVDALAHALGIAVDWRWVGRVEVGISAERETDRTWLTGPNLSIELPVFNQHQAAIARLEARLRRSFQRLTSQAVEIRSEVRRLRDRLVMKRQLLEHYRDTLLPLRQRIVSLTMQKYNFMLLGAFDLLAAKQSELQVRRDYQLALRDYWIARTELRRAVGGKLPESVEEAVDIQPGAGSSTPSG